MYEIVQLEDSSYDVSGYISKTWKKLDVTYYALQVFGAVTFIDQSYNAICHTALALSAVPLCLRLLQYLSVNTDLEISVIAILNLREDKSKKQFFSVYAILILGLGIALFGIYHSSSEFHTVADDWHRADELVDNTHV